MKGNVKMDVPKKFESKLDEICKDSDGYWAFTIDGFHFAGMGGDCHTPHEDTKKDLLAMIRTIEKCSCKECKAAAKEKRYNLDTAYERGL